VTKYCCVCCRRYDNAGIYEVVKKGDQEVNATHGYCRDCFLTELKKINKMEKEKKDEAADA